MTQRFLAEQLGVTEHALSWWKRESIPKHRQAELCAFFNQRLPGLELTPEALIHDNISETTIIKDRRGIDHREAEMNSGIPGMEAIISPALAAFRQSAVAEISSMTHEEWRHLSGIMIPNGVPASTDLLVIALRDFRRKKEKK